MRVNLFECSVLWWVNGLGIKGPGAWSKTVAGHSRTYLQSQLLEIWRQKDHLLTVSLGKVKETLFQKQNQNKSAWEMTQVV
jgi:hypothetical protein